MHCRLLTIKLYSALHALSSFCHALSSAKTLLVSFSSCFVISLSCMVACLPCTVHHQHYMHSYLFCILMADIIIFKSCSSCQNVNTASVTSFCYMVLLFSLMQVLQDSQHAKLLLRLVSNGVLIFVY